jgi:hypothetical protein
VLFIAWIDVIYINKQCYLLARMMWFTSTNSTIYSANYSENTFYLLDNHLSFTANQSSGQGITHGTIAVSLLANHVKTVLIIANNGAQLVWKQY